MRLFSVLFAIILGFTILTVFAVTSFPTHPVVIVSIMSAAACSSVYAFEHIRKDPDFDPSELAEISASLKILDLKARAFLREAEFPAVVGFVAAYGCAFFAMFCGCSQRTFFVIWAAAFVLGFLGTFGAGRVNSSWRIRLS